MDRNWKQLLGTFLLGVMLPLTLLRFKGWTSPVQGAQQETFSPPEDTIAATQSASVPNYVPVMTGDSVSSMELDAYLVGVVLGEMPASFGDEALKAQAVVARTYTLRHTHTDIKHPGGAICTDSGCCQAYVSEAVYLAQGGDPIDVDKIRGAVYATSGWVVTYGGELIDATYFSCSGGRTEEALAVWGEYIPYLQSVVSPGEEQAHNYISEITLSAHQFKELIGVDLKGAPVNWFGNATYTVGGGVAMMVIGGITYTGTQLRQVLGLNSTAFSVEVVGDNIVITTSGKGHRVGMSQHGANAMAADGSTWQEILTHYYQGIRIDKWKDIG